MIINNEIKTYSYLQNIQQINKILKKVSDESIKYYALLTKKKRTYPDSQSCLKNVQGLLCRQ